jgi:hypothetical protein
MTGKQRLAKIDGHLKVPVVQEGIYPFYLKTKF